LTLGQVLVEAGWVLILVLTFVPGLTFAFGLGWLNSELVEDPARARPGSDDPEGAERLRQFEALGFRPAGMTRESGWFISPLTWFWRSLEGTRWMATPDGLMHTTFHRLSASEPVRFGVVTLIEGGGLVRTTCPGQEAAVKPTARYARFELQNVDPSELVAHHRQNVETFCQQRQLVPRPATFREAAAAALALDRLATKGRLRGGVAHGYREIRTTPAAFFVAQGLNLIVWPLSQRVRPPAAGMRHLFVFVFAVVLPAALVAVLFIRPSARRQLRSTSG
jgi:hypothetical protein